MARINLLPWREWERERRKKQFLANLGVCLAVALLLVVGAGVWLDGSVDTQEARNQRFNKEIRELNTKIKQIENLRKNREELLSRMRVIQQLQGNRPVIVRVFDELVQTLAKGVHYDQMEMSRGTLSITGTAESNNRISALMRNLDASEWFADPNLKSIQEDPGNSNYGGQASTFQLTFRQINPKAPEAGE